jgi:hypothetical protein
MMGATFSGAVGSILMKKSHLLLLQTDDLLLTVEELRLATRKSWAYWALGALVCQTVFSVGFTAFALNFAAQSLLSPFISVQVRRR